MLKNIEEQGSDFYQIEEQGSDSERNKEVIVRGTRKGKKLKKPLFKGEK